MVSGELYLGTPDEPAIGDAFVRVKETRCIPGDIIVQRGTLHS